MPIVNPRVLIVALFILTIVSGFTGLYIYYQHISPLRTLASSPPLGEVLDSVTMLEYTMNFDGETLSVEVSNDPAARKGEIRVLSGGELVYTLSYEYSDTRLINLTRIYPNGTVQALDPIEYEEAFLTNALVRGGPQEGPLTVEAFPGIAPLYAFPYLTGVLSIDWSTFYTPRGNPPSTLADVTVDLVKVDVGNSNVRGVAILITPPPAAIPLSKWSAATIAAEVVKLRGVTVAYTLTISFPLPEGNAVLTVTLESVTA